MAAIPEAEFQTWYPVAAAVERLRAHGFNTEAARQTILGGLRKDEIQSAAERTLKVSKVPGRRNEDLRFAPMRSAHWSVDNPPDSFWADGNAVLRKNGVAEFVYHHGGIRFRRDDIDRLAGQKAVPPRLPDNSGPVAWHDAHWRRPNPEPVEFETWLKATELFVDLPRGKVTGNLAIRLANRLRDGQLWAAATKAIWRDDDGQLREAHRVHVDPDDWAHADGIENYWSGLWENGEARCSVRDDDNHQRLSVSYYGIRFERTTAFDAIPGLADATPPLPTYASSASAERRLLEAGVYYAKGGPPPGGVRKWGEVDLDTILPTPDGPMTLRDMIPATMGDVARAAQGMPNDRTASSVGSYGKRVRPPKNGPTLSDPQMKRFSAALLAGADKVPTEVEAFNAVKAAFAQNHVSRDRFLPIFRAERGPKLPGRTKG